jgi:sugar phosphate isomerase/epimerase
MKLSRKDFLKIAGTTAASLALPQFDNGLFASDLFETNKRAKKFGLQLYGIRNSLDNEPKEVFKQVASFGYKQIELFEHSKHGMFFGMGNKGFKQFIEDLGMSIPSAHADVYKNFEKKVEDAAAIGIKYFICAYEGPGKSLDDYKRYAEDFNKKGEFCKQHGIRFAFHNHDFSFKQMDGVIPQQWLLEHTEKDLVDFQIDLYWVIVAGEDPVQWVNRYPTRFKLAHFKDRTKGATIRDGKAICELGTGTIDFPTILNKIRHSSIRYFIVDQDNCVDRTDPMQCIKDDADYMKRLRW